MLITFTRGIFLTLSQTHYMQIGNKAHALYVGTMNHHYCIPDQLMLTSVTKTLTSAMLVGVIMYFEDVNVRF